MSEPYVPHPNPLISYPIPLEDGRVGHLRVPKFLSQSEADRLAAMVQTLVISAPVRAPLEDS